METKKNDSITTDIILGLKIELLKRKAYNKGLENLIVKNANIKIK